MQHYGGISRYFANLNAGLAEHKDVESAICTMYTENEYIKSNNFPLNNLLGNNLFHGRFSRINKWNRRFCALQIRMNSFDVFHPTYYDPYFLGFLKKPLVLTVHDMIHENSPHLFSDAAEVIDRKKKLIERANAIIAISNYTKNELVKFFPQFADKVTVVHHGLFPYISKTTDQTQQLSTPQRYILFVGDRWHYKNFLFFIESISDVLRTDDTLFLICAGGGTFSIAENALLEKLRIGDKCIQMDVTDAKLSYLYSSAILMVFPSLQEGFGLPIIEAFNNKCPIACSNNTVFPEVAGNAAEYFDPKSKGSIITAVTNLIYDDERRSRLISNGAMRLKEFSAEKCVIDTLKIYTLL